MGLNTLDNMISEKQLDEILDGAVERQVAIIARGLKDRQMDDDPEEFLLNGLKKHIAKSLENLQTLYDTFIDTDECTVQTALEYIPMFAVYGTLMGSQLGVAQDEYNAIVDYFIDLYNLYEE